jgi:SAM-dependent methyltransferase
MAESFGANAEAYDRARPRYPVPFIRRIASEISGPRILDVGIGTGISALPFRELGFDVVGVEVDERMAQVARARGFEVEIAGFEGWRTGSPFDAVISGQTWHWIDPDAGAAAAAAALRPRGLLALFWNSGLPTPEIAARFGAVFESIGSGLPFTPWNRRADAPYAEIMDSAADGLARTGRFASPRRIDYEWSTTIPKDAWLEQVPTSGGINRLPADKIDRLLAGMSEIVDEVGGELTLEYTTVALLAERA